VCPHPPNLSCGVGESRRGAVGAPQLLPPPHRVGQPELVLLTVGVWPCSGAAHSSRTLYGHPCMQLAGLDSLLDALTQYKP
jgi:hypothetical protein